MTITDIISSLLTPLTVPYYDSPPEFPEGEEPRAFCYYTLYSLPALGLNWIKLGLQDVLYDPKTKMIYTPNMNQSMQMSENPVSFGEKTVDNGGEGGIIEEREFNEDQPRDEQGRWTSGGGGGSSAAHDSGSGNIAITDVAVENVPKVSIFDDEKKNERYRQANKDLLKEAQKHPVGTEVSRVYDADMNPIEGYGYRVGEKPGQVKIDNPDVPYHAFHNHPSGESLSTEDLLQLALRDNQLSITAEGNNANNFCMTRTSDSDASGYATFLIKKMDEKTFGGGRYSYKEIKEFDISELSDDMKNDIVQQLKQFNQECLKGGEKYGFTYIESKTG